MMSIDVGGKLTISIGVGVSIDIGPIHICIYQIRNEIIPINAHLPVRLHCLYSKSFEKTPRY